MSTPDSGSQPTPPPSEQRIPQPPVARQQFPPPQQSPGQQPYPMPPAGYQAPQSFPAPPKRSRTATVVAIISGVFAVLFLAGAIGATLLYFAERDKVSDATTTADQRDSRRNAAQRAACDYMTLSSTYSYLDLDSYFDAMQKGSTDSWHKSFTDSAPDLRDVLKSSQSHSKMDQIHCGIASLMGDSAEVVAVVKQTSGNNLKPEPVSNTISALLSLREQPDGRWLVSDLQPAIK